MKRYNFRLQKLLNLESQREQQAKMKIYSLINDLRGQEKILDFLKDSLYQNQKNLAGKEDVSTDSQKLMLYQNYIIALRERIGYQVKKIDEVVLKVDNGKNDLLIIQKDRKILEKLSDKDREKYTVEMRKMEIKQIDDISTSRQFLKSSD